MAKACAYKGCGARKAHPVHGQFHRDYHPFMDKAPIGLQPMSADKRAYLDSEKHQAVYAEALGDKFCVGHAAGAPGRCTERLTPHHILPRSQAGGQEAAEEYPVVMLCDWLNDAVQSIPEVREWAKMHYFHRNGRDWPFLLSAADVRKDGDLSLRAVHDWTEDDGVMPLDHPAHPLNAANIEPNHRAERAEVQPREKRRRLT